MSFSRRIVASATAVVVEAVSIVVAPLPVAAGIAPASSVPSAVDDDVSVAGRGVDVLPVEPDAAVEATEVTAPADVDPVWPGAARAEVGVPVPSGRASVADVPPSVPVGGVSVLADGAAAEVLPPDTGEFSRSGPGAVSFSAPAKVDGLAAGGLSRVRVVGASREAASRLGAAQLFSLERADGRVGSSAVDVQVDYSGYAEAFGGNYADRLRLVAFPACMLSTPEVASCAAPRPVQAVNHPVEGTLTARVPVAGDFSAVRNVIAADGGEVPATVFGVMSSGQGVSTGDYEATDLNPDGTWQVGLSSRAPAKCRNVGFTAC